MLKTIYQSLKQDREISLLKQQALKNSVWNFFTIIASRLGTLIITIILARLLMPKLFGLYILVMSLAFIFLTFADLGINSALVRYVSDALARKQKGKVKAYFRYIFKIKLFLTSLVSLALLFLSYPISYNIYGKPELFAPLLASSIFIFFLGLQGFFESVFFSFKKVKYLAIKEIILEILKISLVVFVLLFVSRENQVTGIIIALILVSLIILLILFFWIKKLAPFIFKKTKERIDKRRVLIFSSWVAVGSAAGVLWAYIDATMLGLFIKDLSYVGYYKAALGLVASVAAFFTFTSVLLPIFLEIKKERIQEAFDELMRYAIIFIIPATFGLAILGRYFIVFLFGYEYIAAALPLSFLSFIIIVSLLKEPFHIILLMRERVDLQARVIVISSFINIIFNYILITSLLKISEIWATSGAAIASLVSQYSYLLIMIYLTRKKLKIRLELKSFVKPLISALLMASALILFNLYIKDMTLFLGIIEVLLGVILYFSFMSLFKGVKKTDIALFLYLVNYFSPIKHNKIPKIPFLKNLVKKNPG